MSRSKHQISAAFARSLVSGMALSIALVAAPAHAQDGEGEDAEIRGAPIQITPYIEAAQVLTAELSPGNDVVTYSRVAVGVDANISGRNTAAAASLRYERMIGWGDDRAPSGDIISGLARAAVGLIPRTLTMEAGAIATRSQVNSNGSTGFGPFSQNDQSAQLYSVYAGPSLTTHVGDVSVNASYRIGYNKVDLNSNAVVAPGVDPIDVFDESITHSATVSAGIAPYDVLPVGLTATVGWEQEDMSNLDLRVQDRYARADITMPVSGTVALVAGVGYEDVEVSLRDAVRDVNGDPVLDGSGRYVTDEGSPRLIAYEADGIIWDAGVVWRPSNRTQLEAHIGRRYDSTTYYGSFGWQPNSRASLNISVYDGIAGFGGRLGNALQGLSTNFTAPRNVITGDIGGCAVSLDGNNCIGDALNSVRSLVSRSQGVTATYTVDMGQTTAAFGTGYRRSKFLAAPGTVIASAADQVDETIWMAAYLGHRLDARSGVDGNVYANFFRTGLDADADFLGYGASVSYYRELAARLTGTAAVSLDGVDYQRVQDLLGASALVGVRYSF